MCMYSVRGVSIFVVGLVFRIDALIYISETTVKE